MFVEDDEKYSDLYTLLAGVYKLFEAGSFAEARQSLNEALALDFENSEVQTALRACGFWQQRAEHVETITDPWTRGSYLKNQWFRYNETYRQDFEHPLEEGSSRIKLWVYSRALVYFRECAEETSDLSAFLETGRCLKQLGRFEESIEAYEKTLKRKGGFDAPLLAELADCYALIGEIKAAKVYMREALFLDAPSIDTGEFASPLFIKLVERLNDVVPNESESFIQWLPVYGALWGVFNEKRSLSPLEFKKLKQEIVKLHSEVPEGKDEKGIIPQLINKYFWMIDHYQSTGADRLTIADMLMNIKLLSPSIYREYFE